MNNNQYDATFYMQDKVVIYNNITIKKKENGHETNKDNSTFYAVSNGYLYV